MQKQLIIIGAGGHAKVVLDAVLKQGEYCVIGFAVDTHPIGTAIMGNYTVVDTTQLANIVPTTNTYFVVALGNNNSRKLIFEQASKNSLSATIIHPSAIIASDVTISNGTIILANVTINAGCIIGSNCIINSGVIIDHDCVINANTHLSIGTIVASKITIASETTTNIGQIITQ